MDEVVEVVRVLPDGLLVTQAPWETFVLSRATHPRDIEGFLVNRFSEAIPFVLVA